MNEILAIVVMAFLAEYHMESKKPDDLENLAAWEIAKDSDTLISFLFDARHLFADVYTLYDQILQFGIKNLYTETKDISQLKEELYKDFYKEEMKIKQSAKKSDLFLWKQKQELEEKKLRAKLEQQYEVEKLRSQVMRKCQRVTHNILKSMDI